MTGKQALTKQLGGKAPPNAVVSCVADEDLTHLAGTVRDARRRQGEALAASGERALGFMPALLRRPVKKILKL